jgi:hypothetical protein
LGRSGWVLPLAGCMTERSKSGTDNNLRIDAWIIAAMSQLDQTACHGLSLLAARAAIH